MVMTRGAINRLSSEGYAISSLREVEQALNMLNEFDDDFIIIVRDGALDEEHSVDVLRRTLLLLRDEAVPFAVGLKRFAKDSQIGVETGLN